MMHRTTYSICEGYELSDTSLRDTSLQLSIVVSPDGVYIRPTFEMSLQRLHALPPSIFEIFLCWIDRQL